MRRSLTDFEIVTTADGSPSLSIKDGVGYGEKMHHSGGALAESIYIYGEALAMVLAKGWNLRVLSLGLGLGYNEMLVAAECCRHGRPDPQTRLYSFESEPLLAENFIDWLQGKSSRFADLYDAIAVKTEQHYAIGTGQIMEWLRKAKEQDRWEIRGPFPEAAAGLKSISCVLYDAFSNKMCPELWSEDVISQTASLCADQCVFATYAVTGNLKRALKSCGFQHVPRPGFSGKRESTFAIRGEGV